MSSTPVLELVRPRNDMRKRILLISPDILLGICMAHDEPQYYNTTRNPVPSDARVLDVSIEDNLLRLIIASESFDLLNEHDEIPLHPCPEQTLHTMPNA